MKRIVCSNNARTLRAQLKLTNAGIDDQIKDAQERIDKEVAEFNARHGRKTVVGDENGGES